MNSSPRRNRTSKLKAEPEGNLCPETLVHDRLNNFCAIITSLGYNLGVEAIQVEPLNAPHNRPRLTKEKMAVYMFFYKGICLKVGMAGAKSKNRYTYQHYQFNGANSCLAKRICQDKNFKQFVHSNSVGKWIMQNTCRINLLMSDKIPIAVLALLECYFIHLLKPKYKESESQKALHENK
jgi:hypothetical protein